MAKTWQGAEPGYIHLDQAKDSDREGGWDLNSAGLDHLSLLISEFFTFIPILDLSFSLSDPCCSELFYLFNSE